MSEPTTPPGWYPDHRDPTLLRWWDGDRWSDRTRPLGSPDQRWEAGVAASADDGGASRPPGSRPPGSGLRTVVLVLIFAAAVGVAGLWLSSALTDAGPDPVALDRGDVSIALCDDRTCPWITDAELADLDAALEADPDVASYRYQSKEEAYARFEELFADQPDLVASVHPDVLPATYELWLAPDTRPEEVVARYDGFPGVEEAFVPTVP